MLGGAGIYIGSHDYLIRASGVILVVVSAYIVRNLRLGNTATVRPSTGLTTLETTNGPGRVLWIISVALLFLLGAALLLMHIDALNGGHEAWPADVFGGVGFACAIVWGWLVTKILRGKTGKN